MKRYQEPAWCSITGRAKPDRAHIKRVVKNDCMASQLTLNQPRCAGASVRSTIHWRAKQLGCGAVGHGRQGDAAWYAGVHKRIAARHRAHGLEWEAGDRSAVCDPGSAVAFTTRDNRAALAETNGPAELEGSRLANLTSALPVSG